MAVILGKNVFIYSGNSGSTAVIAAAKSCTFSTKRELIEKASSTQGVAKEFTTGRYEWDVTIQHLVVSGGTTAKPNEFQAVDILKEGSTVTISVYINGKRRYGSAICTQADISGAVGGIATGSASFKGTGELSSSNS